MNHMQYESLESAQTNIFFSVIFGTTDEKRRLSQDFKPWVCKIYREPSARNWGAGTYIWRALSAKYNNASKQCNN